MKLFAFITAVVLSSAAWGQVIFAPPPAPVRYDSDYEQAMLRLSVLSQPRIVIVVQPNDAENPVRVFNVPLIPPPMSDQAMLEAGYDPQTGQPLFFRKRDLLPPEMRGENRPAPLTRPSAEPAGGETPRKGQVVIKPYVPREGSTGAGR